jgi:glycosyltransferase involved in cell wall biosynthesis
MASDFPRTIAYLTGLYPKASHTFIQREIAALRSHGAEIRPASIRRPNRIELVGPEEKSAFEETFYVLDAARNPLRLLGDHAALFMKSPGRWLSTFALAMKTGRPGAKGLVWQLFYFAEAGVLARWLQRSRAEHLHNHFGDVSANVAMLAASLADCPFSFTLHGPTEFFAPEAWRLDKKIGRAVLVIGITHFARSQAMVFSDSSHWEKIRIVHCGVAPEKYAAPTPPDVPGLRLLFVGRLTPLKGLRILFAALERIRRHRTDITLTVIGDGEELSWAKEEARRIGGIELLGLKSQSEVAEALAAADALVLPSFAEGLPVVLMEALATGRPVIASRIAGVGELVEDKVTGLLVAPGDVAGLEEAILALADDPNLRANMGAAGRARVQDDFDCRKEALWLLNLFRGRGGDGLRPMPVAIDPGPSVHGS